MLLLNYNKRKVYKIIEIIFNMSAKQTEITEMYSKLYGPEKNLMNKKNPDNKTNNFQKMQKRHGPIQLYAHIMKASRDREYAKNNSLARPPDVVEALVFKPAERKRTDDREVYEISVSKETQIETQNTSNQEKPYEPYKPNYSKSKYLQESKKKDDDNTSAIYRVISAVEQLKEKSLQYLRTKYRNRFETVEPISSKYGEKVEGIVGKVSYSLQNLPEYLKKEPYRGQIQNKREKGYLDLIKSYFDTLLYGNSNEVSSTEISDVVNLLEVKSQRNQTSNGNNRSELEDIVAYEQLAA